MTGQEYPGRRRTESAAFGWERRRFGAGEDSPGAWAETPPADPAGRKRGERAPFGALNVGGTTKCDNLHALVPLICGGTGACCCFLGAAPLCPLPLAGVFLALAMPRLFCLRRPTFVTEQKWAKVSLEPAVLRTPFALTCTGSPVLLAWRLPLSAGGRYGCPRVRALSALAWWVDGSLAGPVGRRGLVGLAGGRGSSPSAETQPDGAGPVGGRGSCWSGE